MKRLHLFEFEDLKWFPTSLRNYGTDFLQFLANKANIYAAVVPVLEKGIAKSGSNQIIDLASGGGGGLVRLNEDLRTKNLDLKILLTDYYPNIDAFKYTKSKASNFDYVEQSVNAMDVPANLKGLRTQFLSLHHFRPEQAKAILQNAVDSGNPIAIFEAQERSVASILAMIFSPLSVIFTTPFIHPFKIGRIIFTYLIPVVPLFIMWDGIVSSLRTYSVVEMEELVSQLNNKDEFEWEIGRVKTGPGVVLYLLGMKK